MTQPGYVFIVGLHRTGTSLVRNILNRSEDVGISAGESFFFGSSRFFGLSTRKNFRKRMAKVGDISTDVGARKIVDYIYDNPQSDFWSSIPENIDREELLDRLLASDQRHWSLFELAMTLGAGGKPICGDKTPAHIYYVPALLERFPDAKIIHMFRDPRAVYFSNKVKYDKRKLSLHSSIIRRSGLVYEMYSSLELIHAWLRVIRLHHQYQQLYPNNYHLFKYEDLIRDPGTVSQRLCDFLGINFIEAMLQQTVVNSSFVPRADQVQGFDTSALERWRKNLHPVIDRWFILWCKKQLLEWGYQL